MRDHAFERALGVIDRDLPVRTGQPPGIIDLAARLSVEGSAIEVDLDLVALPRLDDLSPVVSQRHDGGLDLELVVTDEVRGGHRLEAGPVVPMRLPRSLALPCHRGREAFLVDRESPLLGQLARQFQWEAERVVQSERVAAGYL